MYVDDFLKGPLEERKKRNALRELIRPNGKVDFCSNDYLGIAKMQYSLTNLPIGSAGSRLLAGNYSLIEETEQQIAAFHQAETALIFNSGYDANIGLLSCVPQKGDTIIYDFLCHASIRDGIRLSTAQSFSFQHNDINDLERRLKLVSGTVFVVTESVFSMDGDFCPLVNIITLCKKYKAHLIIDEAHATGVVGKKGEGLVQHLLLQDKVFARVHTFGKAVGCHGAVVLGSQQLRSYLINFARSFIYSTSLSPHSVSIIKHCYNTFPFLNEERKHLEELIKFFQSTSLAYTKLDSLTPIQIVIIEGNDAVKSVAEKLQANNLDVRAILNPTVPKGKERLRIVLHSYNTMEELKELTQLLE